MSRRTSHGIGTFRDGRLDRSFRGRDPRRVAQSVPGPATEHFCALAKELRIYLTIPLVERVDHRPTRSRRHTNPKRQRGIGSAFRLSSTPFASPRPTADWLPTIASSIPGRLPNSRGPRRATAGLAVYDTEYGRVGLAICFDIHTILAHYANHRLWALLFPTAWVDEEHPADWFHHRLPSEIAKHKFHVIGANWSVDRPQRWRGYGFSTIISAEGQVLATAKSLYGSEIVFAELASGCIERQSAPGPRAILGLGGSADMLFRGGANHDAEMLHPS